MYDIGKIGILEWIFFKFGLFVGEEWEIVNKYLRIGGDCFVVIMCEGGNDEILEMVK